jgi:hypothetical protein
MIFTKSEVDKILEILGNDHVLFNTVEEAIDFATISVMSNSSFFFFIFNITLTEKANL